MIDVVAVAVRLVDRQPEAGLQTLADGLPLGFTTVQPAGWSHRPIESTTVTTSRRLDNPGTFWPKSASRASSICGSRPGFFDLGR